MALRPLLLCLSLALASTTAAAAVQSFAKAVGPASMTIMPVPQITSGLTPSPLSATPLATSPLTSLSPSRESNPPPRDPPDLSPRDLARDKAAARLAAAGFSESLHEEGLVLWHILRYTSRSGEKVTLTVSLPPDGKPFERGGGDPGRRAELERRLASAQSRIVFEAARALGMPEDMVAINPRLIEGCCGAGCQSCLLTKAQHAVQWTSLQPRTPTH